MHKKNHFSFLILTSIRIAWMSECISNFINWRDSKYAITWTNKPPLLSEISRLRGLWNLSTINCAVGNDLSAFVSALTSILTWLLTTSLRFSNLFLMELIFKFEHIIFFEYLERFNLRVFVKWVSFEALGLMHIQSNFSSLFKKLSSNHPELTRDFRKLSASIDVPCLFRCSLPLFKQVTSILLLSTMTKPSLKQYFWSNSFSSYNFIRLVNIILTNNWRKTIQFFFHCPFPRRWQ